MTTQPGDRRSVGQAYAWAALGQAGSLVAALLLDAARGRLFEPPDVGRYVAAMWLLGLVMLVSDAGIGTVVVSARNLDPRKLTALCDLAVMISCLSCVVMLAGAPMLDSWTRSRSVAGVAAGLAPAVILAGVGAVHRALLLRRMDFRAVAFADLAGLLGQLTVTVGGAVLMRSSVWPIVGGVVLGQLVRSTALRVASGLRAVRPADWSRVSELARDGADITGSRLLSYAYMNADYFLLSRWATFTSLATYYNAFRLATLPGLLVSNVVQQVSFPAFSASEDSGDLRARFISTLRLAATLGFPAAFGLVVSAPAVVALVYGPGWGGSVPVLQLLAIPALTRSLQVIGPSMLLARGHARLNVLISAVYVAALIPAFWLSLSRGAVGVAMAWAVVAAPLDMAVLFLGARVAGVGLGALLATVWPPAYRAATMALLTGGALALTTRVTDSAASLPSLGLALAAMAGGAVFFAAWTFRGEADLRDLVASYIGRRT